MKPLPIPGPDDRALWEGAKRHELLVQRCIDCGAMRFWDRPMCPQCRSFASEPHRATGRGTIWSYTTTHHAFNRAWKEELPYTVVVVELEEGPRMTSNLVDAGDDAAIGALVEVVFDDVSPEVTLPKFRLVR